MSNKSESINNIPQVNENEPLEKRIRADNYRVKIVRDILNKYLYNKVKTIIKGIIQDKFKKFPIDVSKKLSRKKNKNFLDMTLKDFYETKELYNHNQNEKIFEHNLNIINELRKDCYKDFREKSRFDDILEMTFSNLVVEYLQSEQYYAYISKLKGEIY